MAFPPTVAEGRLEFFFFFRGAVSIMAEGFVLILGGFVKVHSGCCCGGDVDAWGGVVEGLDRGGFFGFRACAVWGCFYQGFFERWGNVLWGMWQRCVAMLVG